MKWKLVVTCVLLAFVAVSVLFILRGEKGPGTSDGPPEKASVRHGLVAYYFHGTRRCPTCRKLETYAQEAIASSFADDLKAGRLEWRVVNVDLPENEHYVRDYALTTKSVVLVAVEDGTEGRWKNLSRIWDLVGDKAAYMTYIQSEVKSFQAGG